MIVYSITNKINNKKYFCVTLQSLINAIYNHRHQAKKQEKKMKLKPQSRCGKSPFHKALARYGENNFEFIEVDKFQNENDAYNYKEFLIEKHNTMNPKYGYNCTTGGNKSFKNTPQTIERMRVANTGKTMSDSFVKIMKARVGELHPCYGIKHSKEIREKMRQGQLNSDYVQTEEQQRKKSVTMKKRWQEPETIAKMAKRKLKDISGKNNPMYGKGFKGKDNPMYGKPSWNRGIPMTEEQKKKLQEGREKYQTKKRKELLDNYKHRTEKECYKCNQIKKLDLFYMSKFNLDGYAGMCKSCEKTRKQKKQ